VRYILEVWSNEPKVERKFVLPLSDEWEEAITLAEKIVITFNELMPDDKADFYEVDWDVPAPQVKGEDRSKWEHAAGWANVRAWDVYVWDTDFEDGPLGC
jgi:hypothetical protein